MKKGEKSFFVRQTIISFDMQNNCPVGVYCIKSLFLIVGHT